MHNGLHGVNGRTARRPWFWVLSSIRRAGRRRAGTAARNASWAWPRHTDVPAPPSSPGRLPVDADRFDALVFALGSDRRALLRSLLPGVAALLGQSAGLVGAAGCQSPGTTCTKGRDCCSGACKKKRGRTKGFCQPCPAGSVYCAGGGGACVTGVCCPASDCVAGQTCCPAGQDCVSGICTCEGGSCSGCCDGTQCRSGTSEAACGANGVACVACSSGQACQNGACECTSQSCSGCCAGQTCRAGTTPQFCGDGGQRLYRL